MIHFPHLLRLLYFYTHYTHQVLESSLQVEGGGVQLPLLHMAAAAGKVGYGHATTSYRDTFLLPCYIPLTRRATCYYCCCCYLLSRHTIHPRWTVCCCYCNAERRPVAATP